MDIKIADVSPHDAYKVLTNIIMPRPIAWVTSVNPKGILNAAPFSFFNMIGSNPPILVLGIGNAEDGLPKHTARNIAVTKEFVVNLVTEELVEQMNLTATEFPEGFNELDAVHLKTTPSKTINVPRIEGVKAAIECTEYETKRIGDNNVVIGQVLSIHVADEHIDPRLHILDFFPIGRLGSPSFYTRTKDRFEIPRISYAQWLSRQTR